MASKAEDLTIEYEEDGVLVVEELDKIILSKRGAWATVLFKYRQWEKAKDGYGHDRYSIRRYRKMGEEYRPQGKFNISSKDQATKIVSALQKWIAEAVDGGGADEEED
ncbi:MAG: hypothetical protein LBU70_07960 [Chitinispirillales bacterium]|jgi:hypothetical protein|nr:hypothetical protein [Chitinispirillales bacterium]